VQDQFVTLQQILNIARRKSEHRVGEKSSTSSIEEEHIVHPFLIDLEEGHHMLQIGIYAI
jgi:hypothetical protein